MKTQDLEMFTGTEQWYRCQLTGLLYTDGIHYLIENNAAWLVTDSLVNIKHLKQLKGEDFLTVKFKLNEDKESGVYTIDDGNGNILFSHDIEYTDFPLDEIKMFFANGVLMLPSEY